MARGWESKSVEEQQSVDKTVSEAAIQAAQKQGSIEIAERTRQKNGLELQRERILSERTSSPVRRAALEAALREIESRIAVLG